MFDIKIECLGLQEQIAADRNYLHIHPELSGQEEKTIGFITARLDTLGIPWKRVTHGGLTAVLKGKQPGRRLLLRADIDALPVDESKENLCRSKHVVSENTGVCHACGHDAHTAMLLGALQILSTHRQEWSGEIVAVFEQGEETSYGAIPLLEYVGSHFDRIDGCFAIHVNADVPEGRLSVQPGYVMSGALGFDVELTGKGGHSSRPDYCNNPIDCFVSIYNDLAAVRMRHTDPNECFTFAIGMLQAGNKSNVIPEKLRFAGLARFFREDVCGRPFLTAAKKIIENNSQIYDCMVKYNYIMEPIPGVCNDGDCAILADACLRRTMGADAVIKADPWMASESMAVYNLLYPGVLAFLGIHNESGCGAPHHSAEFDLNEDLLYLGTEAFVSYASSFLDDSFTPPDRQTDPAVLEQMKKQLL